MSKFAVPLALAAVTLVAACAYRATPAPAPVVVVPQQPPAVVQAPPAPVIVAPQPTALRPGFGRVESISAASSAGSMTSALRRLGIRSAEGRSVDVYFDNDQKAAAPKDARRLIELLEGHAGDDRHRHSAPRASARASPPV